jgi:hypothetical protein
MNDPVDFDAMALQVFAEHGITQTSSDVAAVDAVNAFLDRLRAAGLYDAWIAQTFAELTDAGLMPDILRATMNRRQRRTAKRRNPRNT